MSPMGRSPPPGLSRKTTSTRVPNGYPAISARFSAAVSTVIASSLRCRRLQGLQPSGPIAVVGLNLLMALLTSEGFSGGKTWSGSKGPIGGVNSVMPITSSLICLVTGFRSGRDLVRVLAVTLVGPSEGQGLVRVLTALLVHRLRLVRVRLSGAWGVLGGVRPPPLPC